LDDETTAATIRPVIAGRATVRTPRELGMGRERYLIVARQ
jgi:hypothetical protein